MILKGVYLQVIGTAEAAMQVDNIAQAKTLGKDGDFIAARIGATWLPQAGPGDTACALGERAARDALARAGVDAGDVGLLVFVSQNPDHGGLPQNAAILQDRLGLPTASICFDLGLGCSGFVYGLVVVASMMKTAGVDTALLVTSDQYRAALKPDDANTQLLFGDGACATVLSTRGGVLELRAARLGTDGSGHTALIRTPDGITMNGRAVFNFSRKLIPAEIDAFLADQGLDKSTLDTVLLHQGSRGIVDEIRRQMDLPQDCVPFEMEGRGNTVSSSIPFLLAPRLGPDGPTRILAAGFGVGLSWGIVLLERPDTTK
ncbi:MAG: ketoacyl-ACP synthase III [Rubellimicrobium sp.]|nr:ketoacyl-ACP synthase III [Rubellimicrobium sp.]